MTAVGIAASVVVGHLRRGRRLVARGRGLDAAAVGAAPGAAREAAVTARDYRTLLRTLRRIQHLHPDYVARMRAAIRGIRNARPVTDSDPLPF